VWVHVLLQAKSKRLVDLEYLLLSPLYTGGDNHRYLQKQQNHNK
jgi:hypothetical protein